MKAFFRRHWPLVGLAILLAVAGFYFLKGARAIIKTPVLKEIVQGKGLTLKDIHYTQDDPEKGLKWILDAEEVKFSENREHVLFHDFRLKLEPKNRPTLKLKGRKGEYSKQSGLIELWGDLEGESSEGYMILTDSLVFDEKSGHLSSDNPVKIYGPSFSTEGHGLIADVYNKTFKILSDVTTRVDSEWME